MGHIARYCWNDRRNEVRRLKDGNLYRRVASYVNGVVYCEKASSMVYKPEFERFVVDMNEVEEIVSGTPRDERCKVEVEVKPQGDVVKVEKKVGSYGKATKGASFAQVVKGNVKRASVVPLEKNEKIEMVFECGETSRLNVDEKEVTKKSDIHDVMVAKPRKPMKKKKGARRALCDLFDICEEVEYGVKVSKRNELIRDVILV